MCVCVCLVFEAGWSMTWIACYSLALLVALSLSLSLSLALLLFATDLCIWIDGL